MRLIGAKAIHVYQKDVANAGAVNMFSLLVKKLPFLLPIIICSSAYFISVLPLLKLLHTLRLSLQLQRSLRYFGDQYFIFLLKTCLFCYLHYLCFTHSTNVLIPVFCFVKIPHCRQIFSLLCLSRSINPDIFHKIFISVVSPVLFILEVLSLSRISILVTDLYIRVFFLVLINSFFKMLLFRQPVARFSLKSN